MLNGGLPSAVDGYKLSTISFIMLEDILEYARNIISRVY